MVLSWAVIVDGVKDRRAEVRRVASPRRPVLLFSLVFMLSIEIRLPRANQYLGDGDGDGGE
eukprot:scaffold103880_cov54-Cyclotella_meneghiniana.AAC.4